MRIRPALPADGARVVELWAAAVDASHDFLSARDRADIGREVSAFLPHAPLLVAGDAAGRVQGFVLATGRHADALFVDPAAQGQGIGAALMARVDAETVDVNEQNAGALAFYRRLGFAIVGRSDRDGEGRPYPLLHLRRQ